MTQLERIEYCRGMLESRANVGQLPTRRWSRGEIPNDVLNIIEAEGILDLGGVYGDPDAGDPIEYDRLKLVLADGIVEIEFFNRGITLFMTDDEKHVRIHRVLSQLNRLR